MPSHLSPADEAFQSLMHAGAVTGICVCAGPKVIRSRMPFATHRIVNTARLIDEAFQHQAAKNRPIDRIWFGLGTFNLLAVTHEGVRVIILHVRDEETDFLAQVGLLFLKDYGSQIVELPEHKRLVTSRILVTAPDQSEPVESPRPATTATSRIPLSARLKDRQEPKASDGVSDQRSPIIPKPIKRQSADDTGESTDANSPPPSPRILSDPEPPRPLGLWVDYRERLLLILEKAVGKEKAHAIIKEEIEAFGGHPATDLPNTWFKEFGNTVISKIKKSSHQVRARNELIVALRDLSL